MNPAPENASGPEPAPTKGRRIPKRIVLACLLLLGAALGLRYYLQVRGYEFTDDAHLEGRIIFVSPKVSGHVVRAHVSDNQWVKKSDLLAEIDARDFEVRLEQARSALRVAEARAGAARKTADLTRVTSGAGVDEASSGLARAEAAVESARTQIAAAMSRREQASAQRTAVEASAEQAAADAAAAQTEAERAESDWRRYQEAIQNRGVSRQQLDQAASAAKAAAARL
ncbi:MAG: biotin/lipoyl-binding protein, partial [Deltaproteobacteria bacterium]|nr:biotin/lipoyl-binding protein [Deltaproteobacteria bacterium]